MYSEVPQPAFKFVKHNKAHIKFNYNGAEHDTSIGFTHTNFSLFRNISQVWV